MSNLSSFDLTGKRAIVTGGSRGLGSGSAEGLMEAGASVAIFGTSETVYKKADEFNRKGYPCKGYIADLSDRKKRKDVFEEAVRDLGGLDIIIQAAGIQRRHPVPDFPVEDWYEVLEVNLTAVFDLSQMAIREFLKKDWVPGNPSRGKIINYASVCSFFGGYTIPAYSAAKGGVMQLTKDLCNEVTSKGINVNAVAPGYMETRMNTAFFEDPSYKERYNNITSRIPAGRWGTPDDMKGITCFLSSSASDYLSGCIIPVDGGYLVR